MARLTGLLGRARATKTNSGFSKKTRSRPHLYRPCDGVYYHLSPLRIPLAPLRPLPDPSAFSTLSCSYFGRGVCFFLWGGGVRVLSAAGLLSSFRDQMGNVCDWTVVVSTRYQASPRWHRESLWRFLVSLCVSMASPWFSMAPSWRLQAAPLAFYLRVHRILQ